jgi:two-component system, sensor histidine kinase and response regulator
LKKKLVRFLEFTIGESDEFTFDHQLFNSICLIVAFSYLLRILINLILRIKLIEIILSHIITSLCVIFLFYLSRFLKKPELSKILFFSVILITFSINWYFSGGTRGAMPFYYFSLLTLIVVIAKGRYNMLVACIVLINAALLIFLEYRNPHLIIQKIEDQKVYMYKYLHFLFISVVTIIIIQTAKTFDRREIYSHSESYKNIQNPEENGNNKASEIFHDLTSQERKVVELILFGKRNKEIATVLNVDLSTVKTHINNIYKKTGLSNRKGILNSINIHMNS